MLQIQALCFLRKCFSQKQISLIKHIIALKLGKVEVKKQLNSFTLIIPSPPPLSPPTLPHYTYLVHWYWFVKLMFSRIAFHRWSRSCDLQMRPWWTPHLHDLYKEVGSASYHLLAFQLELKYQLVYTLCIENKFSRNIRFDIF